MSKLRSVLSHILIPAIILAAGLLGFYLVLIELGVPAISLAVVLGFPIISGMIIMYFRPKGTFKTFGLSVVWLIVVGMLPFIMSYITGVESLICITMAVIPVLMGTMLGGLIYLVILKRRERDQSSLQVVTAPVLVIGFLSLFPVAPQTYDITHSIDIDAPPNVVFGMLKSIPDISPDEVPTRFTHRLGVPKPTQARWVTGDDATIRHSHWGPDVHFHERITALHENRLIAWEFEFPEGWIAEGIEDPHIKVGGAYFDVLSGGYRLEDLGGRTRLFLTTRTYDNSNLGFYAEFWHRFFFEDFHEVILALVKQRTEALDI